MASIKVLRLSSPCAHMKNIPYLTGMKSPKNIKNTVGSKRFKSFHKKGGLQKGERSSKKSKCV